MLIKVLFSNAVSNTSCFIESGFTIYHTHFCILVVLCTWQRMLTYVHFRWETITDTSINNKYVKQDNQATSCHSGKCKYTCRVNTGSYIYVCISYIVLMFVLFSFVQLCVRVYVRVMGNSFYISNWDLDMLDEEIRLNSPHVRGYFFQINIWWTHVGKPQ